MATHHNKEGAGKKPAEERGAESTKNAAPRVEGPAMFGSLTALRDSFDRFFDTMTQGWPQWSSPLRETGGGPMSFSPFGGFPRVDTSESEKAYEITVELPGVDEEDVSISVDDGVLTIKGEKKSEREEKDKDYHLMERSFGSFQRSFRVPDNVDDGKIDAKFKKGVLHVEMPKIAASKSKSKKIEIKS
jgi:HSP20 family protein